MLSACLHSVWITTLPWMTLLSHLLWVKATAWLLQATRNHVGRRFQDSLRTA
jgi:hypothetical protein